MTALIVWGVGVGMTMSLGWASALLTRPLRFLHIAKTGTAGPGGHGSVYHRQ